MAARSSFFVLVALCFLFGGINGLANPNECISTDTGACNNNGLCIAGGDEYYCSCYSGYSGIQCATPPPSEFYATPITSEVSDFSPVVDFTLGGQVTMVVLLPAEISSKQVGSANNVSYSKETRLKFSKDSETACDYPTAAEWSTGSFLYTFNSTTKWYDQYIASFDYSQLVACGLAKRAVSTRADYMEYSTQLIAFRSYVLKDKSGSFALNRTESIARDINIFFPTKVYAQTTIGAIDNSVATFTGITGYSYNVSTDLWSFTLSVLVSPNYQLALSGDPLLSHSSRTVTFGSLTDCTGDNSENCEQIFTISAEGCSSLDFRGVLNFDVVCRSNNPNCVAPAKATVSPTIHIATASSCPVGFNLTFSDVFMKSYQNSSLTTPLTYFGSSNTIYFGVGFQSVATVAGVSIENVCVRPFSTASAYSACGTNVGDILFNPSIVDLSPNSTFQFAFSLAGKEFKQSFSLSRTTSLQFIVQADLTVDTVDLSAKKRSVIFQSTQTQATVFVQDESQEVVLAQSDKSSATSLFLASSLLLATIVALLF